jgi:5-methylcytosine-specific restriction endonuclease McrA
MKVYFSEQVRQFIAERAGYRCEYCKVRQADAFIRFEIDHVISQKHGGGSEIENLAFACPHCNSHKGSDLTTYLDSYQDIVPLYNPRIQNWQDHFSTETGVIVALTRIGQASIKLLQLNDPDRVMLRELLYLQGYWPG